MTKLIGFVRELVMNDDPEHQWIEKIRTSRASNEARQGLFSQLAGKNLHEMDYVAFRRSVHPFVSGLVMKPTLKRHIKN